MRIRAARHLRGRVELPGDKSISHRAVMIGSIAEGITSIENFGSSVDCASTIDCFRSLGVEIERSGSSVTVHGKGLFGLQEPDGPLDCGNSGTTMRLISGILAAQTFGTRLIGDESLSGRPMKRVIEPLSKMGAVIDSVNGHAPLDIHGRSALSAIEYITPVASAQIKSCVLLAGLFANGETTVIESTATRDHTERMLSGFGADIRTGPFSTGRRITVTGRKPLTAQQIRVPGDISSAAFFLVAAACLAGSRIEMHGVGLNPTRNAIIQVLTELGAQITVEHAREICGEPIGDLVVTGGTGRRTSDLPIAGTVIANIIDEIPVLAVFGTQIDGGLEIRDAAELRVKESDRISAVVTNLRKMGAAVEEYEDGFRIERSDLKGAVLETFHDHRIAMAFGIAGLFAEGETEILGAECADVSYPGFFEVLADLSEG